MSAAVDVRSDDGLRRAARTLRGAGSWDTSTGRVLLAEIRRRAVRNAADVARMVEVPNECGLVDDVVSATWLVLHRYRETVLAAARLWAYLMRSGQRQALEELRAQQLLTSPTDIRGRRRHVLPRHIARLVSAAAEVATALRHEPSGPRTDSATSGHIVRPSRPGRPLVAATTAQPSTAAQSPRPAPVLAAFVNLLVDHGANQAVTVAALDRLADLLPVTRPGCWEWAARRDAVLSELGLTPSQCGALVQLVAGSRRLRHNGRHDAVLGAVRTAIQRGQVLDLSAPQRRRIAAFTARPHLAGG